MTERKYRLNLDRFIGQTAERVAPVFKASGWEWSYGEHGKCREVPSEGRIAASLSRMIETARSNGGADTDDGCQVSSGRLSVWCSRDGIEVSLSVGDYEWSEDEGGASEVSE